MRVCFATNNQHKLREVQNLLGDRFQLVTLQEIGCTEELREDQDTIEGNSWQKANYVFTKYGIPTFADDSGLTVDALNGAPGVDSAHYAGPQRNFDDNMALLLKNLAGKSNRKAQFRTIITWMTTGTLRQFEGIIPGTILEGKQGTGGFGYDPLFLPDGYSKTFAEMSDSEKNEISHRSIAVKKLIEFLTENP